MLKAAATAIVVGAVDACVAEPLPERSAAPPGTASARVSASTQARTLGGTLTLLQGSHALAERDAAFDTWAAEWGARNGVNVRIDRVPRPDVPVRVAAEAAARSGHDIVGFWTQGGAAYQADLIDLSDIATGAASRYGGHLPIAEAIGKVGASWRAYPSYFSAPLALWRKDAWQKAGFPDGPARWEELGSAGATLLANGTPIGIAYSRAPDAEHTFRSLLWSYGGAELSADGASAAIDSAETRDALTFAKDLYARLDPAVATWSDADNETCLGSGRCAWAFDPLETYLALTSARPDVARDLVVGPPLAGPKARAVSVQWEAYGIWSFARNVEAARAFLADLQGAWPALVTASRGLDLPFLRDRLRKPMPVLGADVRLQAVQDVAADARAIGWPAHVTAAAHDVLRTHAVSDMFTSYAAGKRTLDEAVAEATRRIRDSIARYPA